MADKVKELKTKLFFERKSGVSKEYDKNAVDSFCEDYKVFLGEAKTERLFVKRTVELLEENGFKPIENDKKYVPGDKVYFNNRGKALYAAVIGQKPVEDGTRIAAAHIDSPRLDLKPNPL